MTVEDGRALAPGAIIKRVWRTRPWVGIETDRGIIYFAGARTAMDLECPICREFRLVEIIETKKHRVGFCKVCGKEFPLHDHKC